MRVIARAFSFCIVMQATVTISCLADSANLVCGPLSKMKCIEEKTATKTVECTSGTDGAGTDKASLTETTTENGVTTKVCKYCDGTSLKDCPPKKEISMTFYPTRDVDDDILLSIFK